MTAVREFRDTLTRTAGRLPEGDSDRIALEELRDLLAAESLTTGLAAEVLGVTSRNTVKRILEGGLIVGATKTSGGHWRIPPEALLEYRAKQLALRDTGSLKPARTPARRFSAPK